MLVAFLWKPTVLVRNEYEKAGLNTAVGTWNSLVRSFSQKVLKV